MSLSAYLMRALQDYRDSVGQWDGVQGKLNINHALTQAHASLKADQCALSKALRNASP